MKSFEVLGAPPLAPSDTARTQAKIKDAAQQFEAMMLGEILKPMQAGGAPGDDGESSGGGPNDTIRGFGTEAVARALSKSGGFGLAAQILRQVTAEHEVQDSHRAGTKV